MVKTTTAWKEVEVYLPGDLQVTAGFELARGQVKEFKVVLHTRSGGPDEWLVRTETHGGKPHKHVAWEDGGELRHGHLKGWPSDYGQLVTKAIQDLKENWQAYEGRYKQWIPNK